MTGDFSTVAAIKGQISKFSGNISKGLSKSKQRLIKEMVYGIQASKDVKLSNITRSLNESIPLIKTEDRLSRNLDDEDFTAEINNQICRLGGAKVFDDMVIAIDPGDIRKKYALKMEHLCKIHDGSDHEILIRQLNRSTSCCIGNLGIFKIAPHMVWSFYQSSHK